MKRKRERFPLFNGELPVTLHDLKRLQNHVRVQNDRNLGRERVRVNCVNSLDCLRILVDQAMLIDGNDPASTLLFHDISLTIHLKIL
jgi:hypothetical protein